MRVSVVLTTYNSPRWLELVLWGFSQQTHTDFEIVIGDDGSGPCTAKLIERMRIETGLPIRHVWQRDDGFRKCRVLNKALLHVRTDYVVFTDGDCIPRRDFVDTHVRNAESGRYLSGSYFKLPLETSEAIEKQDVLSGRCFDVGWLRDHGLPKSRNTIKVSATPWQAKLFNLITTTRCNLKGSNASAWTRDIAAVNGFDERMSYGGLDREFGVRLQNRGIKPKHVRFDAICIHLDHPRGYRDEQLVAQNKSLRQFVAREGIATTEYGLQQLVASGYLPNVPLSN